MKWEYKYWQADLTHTIEQALSEMNKLGAEGWELVSQVSATFWFKRPLA